MKKYKLQLTNEMIVPYGGLAMAGLMIHKTALPLRADTLKVPASKVKISNADVLSTYIGLLCQGRNEFDHIDIFRDEPFFSGQSAVKQNSFQCHPSPATGTVVN